MKSLIVGAGQIGQALQEIFLKAHVCVMRDVDDFDCSDVEILHIAYPYSDSFVRMTKTYIEEYKPKLTIIHSSVKVGTTDQCGPNVVHSPERGRHPHLAEQMQKFPKFIGGGTFKDRLLAQRFFAALKWETVIFDEAKWTELVKLLSNAHLALEIAWRQEVDRIAQALIGQPASGTYNAWELSYNKGHQDLGHRQLIRPIVRPAPIGGHCILPCTDMLAEQYDSTFFDLIRESNAKRQTEESTSDSAPTNGAVSHR